jgi:TetR/AcrR family transcriptional repressor of nem operon
MKQVRYSKEHNARTRATIVKTACRCFREQGIDGISVSGLMSAAGLTHGGFYCHFASKETLVAEAVKHGLEESRQYLDKWARDARTGESPFEVIIRNYLSKLHRDNPATGCPLPALGPEIARGGAKPRTALTVKLKEIVSTLVGFAKTATPQERQTRAIGLLSTIVGAMVLARATNDADFSDLILRDAKSFLFDASRGQSNSRRGTSPPRR